MKNIEIQQVKESAAFLKKAFNSEIPEIAVILGSGLGDFTKVVDVIETIEYKDIPGFPVSTVAGHAGALSIAKISESKSILLMRGRFHPYEGYTPQEVTFPVAVMAALGVKKLIVSNAAGGLNPSFSKGDIMIINDHINLLGGHPLIGKNDDLVGPRFLDMTEPYSHKLIKVAKNVAKKLNITFQEGCYVGFTGPTYETKSEVKFARVIGGDTVGMSTVWETIIANYFKIEVLGFSCVTNMATGIADKKHDHHDVVEVANRVSATFSNWVKETIIAL
ncbi:MAG: purine-nucleoside phosphorylase [Fusobacteria bacterium]|nr:purine-nucleoside phosphorylase [Fusobacteriota bacterium]